VWRHSPETLELNPIGIMQGRLSSPSSRRLQAFPWASWEDEFPRARALGFDCIEWLFEDEQHEENPLWTAFGRRRISQLLDEHSVEVRSVCADYFMLNPFFRVTARARQHSIDVLQRLIEHAAAIGAGLILIPLLEVSAIRDERDVDELVAALEACLPAARTVSVRLGLETELPVASYVGLIERIGDEAVGAYYDVGNAAAQGYDCAADIRVLGASIYGVHIKDRIRNGGSVPLGQGGVDFPAVLGTLYDIAYHGALVLQTAFDSDYMASAIAHRRFIGDVIASLGARPE